MAFGDPFGPLQLAGGAVILVGIVLGLPRSPAGSADAEPAPPAVGERRRPDDAGRRRATPGQATSVAHTRRASEVTRTIAGAFNAAQRLSRLALVGVAVAIIVAIAQTARSRRAYPKRTRASTAAPERRWRARG